MREVASLGFNVVPRGVSKFGLAARIKLTIRSELVAKISEAISVPKTSPFQEKLRQALQKPEPAQVRQVLPKQGLCQHEYTQNRHRCRIDSTQRNYRNALRQLRRLQAEEAAGGESASPQIESAKPEIGFVPQDVAQALSPAAPGLFPPSPNRKTRRSVPRTHAWPINSVRNNFEKFQSVAKRLNPHPKSPHPPCVLKSARKRPAFQDGCRSAESQSKDTQK